MFELSFSHHSPPLPSEHINDEIDETNIFVFCLQWLFVPEYLLYQVVSKASDAHSYIDEVAKFVYGVGTLVGVCTWVMMLLTWMRYFTSLREDYKKKHPESDGRFTKKFFFEQIFQSILLTIQLTSLSTIFLSLSFFGYAVLNYYVIWWIVPLFFNTFVFYFHIFMFIPFTIFAIIINHYIMPPAPQGQPARVVGYLTLPPPEAAQIVRYSLSAISSVSHYFLLLKGADAVCSRVQDYYRRHFRS
jgi:hypothetical protein